MPNKPRTIRFIVPEVMCSGCSQHIKVRLQVDDARWLRYDFVEGPNAGNGYRGTRVIVKPY